LPSAPHRPRADQTAPGSSEDRPRRRDAAPSSWAPELLGTRAPGHLSTPSTWAPELLGTRAPGHPGTRAPGHPSSRARRAARRSWRDSRSRRPATLHGTRPPRVFHGLEPYFRGSGDVGVLAPRGARSAGAPRV